MGTADLFAGSRERAIAAALTTAEDCYASAEAALEATDPEAVLVNASQNYRFFPAVQEVQKIVAERTYGDLLSAVTIDFRQLPGADGVVAPHHALAEPLLVDMSIHHFDLIRTVLGRESPPLTSGSVVVVVHQPVGGSRADRVRARPRDELPGPAG